MHFYFNFQRYVLFTSNILLWGNLKMREFQLTFVCFFLPNMQESIAHNYRRIRYINMLKILSFVTLLTYIFNSALDQAVERSMPSLSSNNRQIIEKTNEHKVPLHFNFIDSKAAFDTIWRKALLKCS